MVDASPTFLSSEIDASGFPCLTLSPEAVHFSDFVLVVLFLDRFSFDGVSLARVFSTGFFRADATTTMAPYLAFRLLRSGIEPTCPGRCAIVSVFDSGWQFFGSVLRVVPTPPKPLDQTLLSPF